MPRSNMGRLPVSDMLRGAPCGWGMPCDAVRRGRSDDGVGKERSEGEEEGAIQRWSDEAAPQGYRKNSVQVVEFGRHSGRAKSEKR